MSRLLLAVFAVLVLSGCAGSPVVYKDPASITIEHPGKGFRGAMEQARQHCQAINKAVKHQGTDCPAKKCISTFSCIAKDAN